MLTIYIKASKEHKRSKFNKSENEDILDLYSSSSFSLQNGIKPLIKLEQKNKDSDLLNKFIKKKQLEKALI